jgi:hypothetical protein
MKIAAAFTNSLAVLAHNHLGRIAVDLVFLSANATLDERMLRDADIAVLVHRKSK